MNTREITKEYRLSHWAGIMRERRESGLSIKAFCESAGFHENIYYYWQRKLREAACQEQLPIAQNNPGKAMVPNGWAVCSSVHLPSANAAPSGRPDFCPVPIVESEHIRNTVPIEIGKCRITANADVDPELLAKVCKVLMSLC